MGSTRLLTDSSGNVVDTTSYSPYGQVTAQSGTVTTPFGFAGQYTDSQTGLVYMRARWYDPGTGQFLSQDPLWPLTTNPYAYVADNPLNGVDPLGLCGPQCSLQAFDVQHYGVNLGCIPSSWGMAQEYEAFGEVGGAIALAGAADAYWGVWAWLDGYPFNYGFLSKALTTLQPGTTLTRYGSETGTYASPEGTAWEERALSGSPSDRPYNVYRIVKAIDHVWEGPARPTYGQPGGGWQYALPQTIEYLRYGGYLEEAP